MKKPIVALALFLMNLSAAAEEPGSVYLRPNIGIGFNSQQGTSFMLGLDLGMVLAEQWRGGLTAHYAAGNDPERDREYGGGVFTSYAQPMTDMVVGHIREEIGHLDIRNPIDPEPTTGPTYESESGVASTTTAGITVYFTENLAISAGYRFVLGITDSDLGDGRSGPTFGVLVGI
jgi:hypothetical protein